MARTRWTSIGPKNTEKFHGGILRRIRCQEGTYKLVGSIYAETIEYFVDPNYIGIFLGFTVKIEEDHLYQSGKFPVLQGSIKVKDIQLDELYRRIE